MSKLRTAENIADRFQTMLEKAITNSEGGFVGYLGTIQLADGREARVEFSVDADYLWFYGELR